MASTNTHRGCPMNGHLAASKKPQTVSEEDPMANFIRPDQPSRCTWALGTTETSPHHHEALAPKPSTLPSILEAVGGTPLVKLNKIPQSMGLKCNVYVKCEFLNPGGSVKDRIGVRMVLEAERKGLLKPGCTIIEPTSGNTGIGLAMAAAARGYRCLIVMPEKMSNEKVDTLKALGAEVIRTPTEAAFDSPEGLIAVSQRLQRSIPDSVILDQYRNAGNPLAHYDGTGAEIVEQLGGQVDMVVIGTGTGGTMTGIGRRIKESCPTCQVIAADPEGSILAEPEELNRTEVSFYEVEGVGYDFLPTVLDRSVVDRWYKFNDRVALPLARRLIRDEGLLCGGSSGGNLYVGLEAAKTLKEGQNCVVILPDNIRNYLTKFVSDNWMEARYFKDSENCHDQKWWNAKVNTLPMDTLITVRDDAHISDAIETMKQNNRTQLPVLDADGTIKGVVHMPNLLSKMLNRLAKPSDLVRRAIFKQYVKIDHEENIGRASRILEKDSFLLVTRQEAGRLSTGVFLSSKKAQHCIDFCSSILRFALGAERPVGILTQRVLFDFVAEQAATVTNGNGNAE
ncbi:cystathionine beta-synthase-like protein isoform X1 [Anopheles gambiae]|uniref:cystathionine beta-synthase-like protein isoform X1 n=1 Tax=Anopheles gambiae TaxID=7165 RepID=UPI002AC8D0C3|nr:cystathionine beta-synthase-like protein isoform X1 [Anopheles gambiae]